MSVPPSNSPEAGAHESGERAPFEGPPATSPSSHRDPAHDRGRSAERPGEIPRQGWRDILIRVWRRIGEDNLTLIASGIAFNAMFAVFPALIVLVSIYGLFSSPADVGVQIKPFFAVMPADAAKLVQAELLNLASRTNATLGLGAAISMAVTLWSSLQGMWALGTATNIAYHESEKRGFAKLLGIALLFTLGAVAGFLLLLALGLAVPFVLKVLPLGRLAKDAALVIRWALLWGFAVLSLAFVYRIAPCRADARWKWVTWGSVIASALWLGGSVLFALYIEHFGNYGRTYGALGGAMVLLMWFYLGSFAVLLGAELNAEMEHQTAVDTTTGPPEPMGRRGAFVADTLGAIPDHPRSESPRSANPSSDR